MSGHLHTPAIQSVARRYIDCAVQLASLVRELGLLTHITTLAVAALYAVVSRSYSARLIRP
jgi:hypothetical protein